MTAGPSTRDSPLGWRLCIDNVLCYINKSKNYLADLTFVKDIFSRKTLVTLLICIFENYQDASQCEEVVDYKKCLFL